MIDLHSHILPGVDDGPSRIEISLKMAQCAVADGIHTLVATPHAFDGTSRNFLPHILMHIGRLKKKLTENQIPLTICPGAEVRIHSGMDHSLKEGKTASINNTGRYMLVEFPHHMVLPGTRDVLFHLFLNGVTPVLAHPERNLALQRNPRILADLVNMGCLVQLTAMSITGELGHDAMEYAHFLLKEGQAHVIATDSHNAENRPPILSTALEATAHILGDMVAAEAMVTETPRKILEGKPLKLPESEKTSEQKGWREKWFGWKKS